MSTTVHQTLVEEVDNLRRRMADLEAANIKVNYNQLEQLVLSCGNKSVTLEHLTKQERQWLRMNFPGIRQLGM